MRNKKLFSEGEADAWFGRNRHALETSGSNKPIELLAEWLAPFSTEVGTVLEIGCGTGHGLDVLSSRLGATGYGVEPSSEAVENIGVEFPSLTAKVGFGDEVPFEGPFDLVHLGFFLYLVDRELLLRCVSEADRLVRPGGFLSIIDFDTPYPYSNSYSHADGHFSHKTNNSDVFTASKLYSVVNKFQFSHSGFNFHKEINERVSLTLLYKETHVFGSKQTG